MSRFLGAVAAAVSCVGLSIGGLAPATAGVVVTVDKTAQHLTVRVDGMTRYSWPVSTARIGYRTPNGSYRPERLARTYFSRKYDWSPMPHSIFFYGGYAIHGSYEVSRLGSPASHGCIRLAPANAATLFALVKANYSDTRIVITGGDGPQEVPTASRRSRTRTSSAEDYETRSRSSGRVNYETYEAPRSRSYETRSYEVRSYDVRRGGASFEEIFEDRRGRR